MPSQITLQTLPHDIHCLIYKELSSLDDVANLRLTCAALNIPMVSSPTTILTNVAPRHFGPIWNWKLLQVLRIKQAVREWKQKQILEGKEHPFQAIVITEGPNSSIPTVSTYMYPASVRHLEPPNPSRIITKGDMIELHEIMRQLTRARPSAGYECGVHKKIHFRFDGCDVAVKMEFLCDFLSPRDICRDCELSR